VRKCQGNVFGSISEVSLHSSVILILILHVSLRFPITDGNVNSNTKIFS